MRLPFYTLFLGACMVAHPTKGSAQQRPNSSGLPVGSVIAAAFDVSRTPRAEGMENWLECDGRSLPVREYLSLFQAIGWTYGLGADSVHRTTFALPDYRGMFLRGFSGQSDRDPDKNGRRDPNDLNRVTGNKVGSVQRDAMQSHKHVDSGHSHGTNAVVGGWEWSDNANDRKVGRPEPPGANIDRGYAQLGDPVDSGTGAGEVRHGRETRPVNISVVWLCRVK